MNSTERKDRQTRMNREERARYDDRSHKARVAKEHGRDRQRRYFDPYSGDGINVEVEDLVDMLG